MGAITSKTTLSFIIVLLLLCYSIQLTSDGFRKTIKNIIEIGKVINKETDCQLCYAPCKKGCKEVFEKSKSSSQLDNCIKICKKKACKCELQQVHPIHRQTFFIYDYIVKNFLHFILF